jgi:hypothetical protein
MGFDVELVSQLHADAVFLLVGLTVALLVSLYATDAPGRVRRAARDLLVVQLAQGVVGYVQYFTDLPIALVLLHMLGAVLVTAFTARLVWSVRGPASELPLHLRRSRPPPRADAGPGRRVARPGPPRAAGCSVPADRSDRRGRPGQRCRQPGRSPTRQTSPS